jgi:hypothetical protein
LRDGLCWIYGVEAGLKALKNAIRSELDGVLVTAAKETMARNAQSEPTCARMAQETV